MAILPWDITYNLGLREIDGQHRQLIEMINGLYALMEAGQDTAHVGSVLVQMVAYARTHLAYEEELMQTHGYPDFTPHKAAHATFIEKLRELDVAFRNGDHQISRQVLTFLYEWFMKHIRVMDKAYAPFLMAQGER